MERKEEMERIERLISVLSPCMKMRKDKEWSTKRYDTEWGTKTPEGLRSVMHRILFEEV